MTRRPRRTATLVVLGLLLLLVPDARRSEAPLALVRLESARAVDFSDDVVWLLALGSDARPGTPVLQGNADAIELVGMDLETGDAAAIGIPRDSLVEVPGGELGRINTGMRTGGPEVMAAMVEDLTGIAPTYVAVSGLEGFAAMVDDVGGLTVRSPVGFDDPRQDISVERGLNDMDGETATAFARARYELAGSDFDRMANHQSLLRAVLDRLRSSEDVEGFIEQGATSAVAHLDTNLAPTEVYRLGQALTGVDPRRVTTCVVRGTPVERFGASVVVVDRTQARRLGADAAEDATLEGGCG